MAAEGWIARLRRFVRAAPAVARCDLCASTLSDPHAHLIEARTRQLVCACAACTVLCAERKDAFRRVPERSERLAALTIPDAQWAKIGIPVGVAFFCKRSVDGQVSAFYPGAAGLTESLLDLSVWRHLEQAHPVLQALEPDVEALVVNHLDGAREYYRAPIDRCYALAGALRASWEGFTGGDAVRRTMSEFFAEADQSHGRMAPLGCDAALEGARGNAS